MLAQFHCAGVFTAIVAVCGPARAQELAPPGSGVSIHKVTVTSPHSRTVKYYVTGGSARLQAVVRRVEWAENELSVIEQLQLLRLDTVVNERRVAAVRAEQLTNPYYPTGFGPPPVLVVGGGYGASHFQRALKEQLVYQATPDSALRLIGFLEQVQTQLDAELKALPPPEQKATQDSVDALRKRVASLPRGDAPPATPRPVVPVMPSGRSQVGPAAPAPAGVTAPVEVRWGNSWFAAEILQVKDDLTLIRYANWGSSADEWVPAGRIRPAGTVSARPYR
jgi:hypothetical protein